MTAGIGGFFGPIYTDVGEPELIVPELFISFSWLFFVRGIVSLSEMSC
jgi:hypothetical protein